MLDAVAGRQRVHAVLDGGAHSGVHRAVAQQLADRTAPERAMYASREQPGAQQVRAFGVAQSLTFRPPRVALSPWRLSARCEAGHGISEQLWLGRVAPCAPGATRALEARWPGATRAQSAAPPTGSLDVLARTSRRRGPRSRRELRVSSPRKSIETLFGPTRHRRYKRFAAVRDGRSGGGEYGGGDGAACGSLWSAARRLFCSGIRGCLVVGRSGRVVDERGRVCARPEET